MIDFVYFYIDNFRYMALSASLLLTYRLFMRVKKVGRLPSDSTTSVLKHLK